MYFKNICLLLSVFSLLFCYQNELVSLNNGEQTLEELYKNYDKHYMEELINLSKEGLKTYVYSDIIQNPPQNEDNYYPKLNIDSELSNINILNERPFYDFYRDYKKALNKIKDINLLVLPETIDINGNKIDFSKYAACLPFYLRMDHDENNETKIYIKEYTVCSGFYEQNVKDFIKNHENVPLIEINSMDVFEFIHNFGKDFYDTRNPHARFNLILRNFHSFYLNMIPFNVDEISDLNFTFGYNETENLCLSYYIIKPDNLFDEKESKEINKDEFDEFFKKEMNNSKGLGNILEIKNKFLASKNIYTNLDENAESIEWNYNSPNGGLKCRVDEKNYLNVFLLTSFEPSNLKNDLNFIAQCMNLFYSNDYKIVGIVSNSLGGSDIISYFLTQLLQPKIYLKYNMAQRVNSFIELFIYYYYNEILDPDTCLPFDDLNSFIYQEKDNYGNSVIHNRTKIYNMISKSLIKQINDIRERLLKEGNPKKPTDILIFTDYISSGSAGLFIKGLQENGGAITAGYLGNPKIKENYDSTESSSLFQSFQGTEIYERFKNLGFEIKSVAFAETFWNYKSIDGTIIPSEYKMNKVDERTNIIHEFDDNSYEEFISEAKNIFTKYNDKEECSINNQNLLFESEQCSSPNEHYYGGYTCDNGKWSKVCKNLYCDVGYYYDTKTQKCKIDPCTKYKEIDVDFEGIKEYQIMPDITYIFNIKLTYMIYSFESPVENLIHHNNFEACTKFCVLKNEKDSIILVNYYQKIKEPVTLKITGIVSDGLYYSYKTKTFTQSTIMPILGKIFYLLQLQKEEFGYFNSFDPGAKCFLAEYNEEMTLSDVINIDTKYFKYVKGKLIKMEINKLYIIAINVGLAFPQIYLRNSLDETIDIYDDDVSLLYLEKGKNYTLNIHNYNYSFLIRLHPLDNSTPQLFIAQDNLNKTLNSSDKYFIPEHKDNIMTFHISNITENVFIEFLYSFENSTEIFDDLRVENKAIFTPITLIQYNTAGGNNKKLEIIIESEGTFGLGVFAGATKVPYIYYSKNMNPEYSQIGINEYKVILEDPLKDIQLEQDENYYVSLIIYKKNSEQEVLLNYYYMTNPIEDLYEELDENYTTKVIANLKSLINGYVFLDYAKNPQPPKNLINNTNYTHPPVDLIKALDNIKTTGIKYYDFYREIKTVIASVRDLHFNIMSTGSPQGRNLLQLTACIPFKLYVDKDINDNNETKVFIKYYENCAIFYDEDIQNYIKNKSEQKIPLKKINDEDPFDYIQNWGWKYEKTKNPHAEFSFKKWQIYSFSLTSYPMTPDELRVKYEFEGEGESNTITLDYHIFTPNVKSLNKLYGANLLSSFNEDEFNKFYKEEMIKITDNVLKPNIFEMLDKFREKKGILKNKIKKDKIKWDYETIEDIGLKCRVDEENKVNVFLQQSFSLTKNVNHAIEVIVNCSLMFYNNTYPIIGIESQNGGGIINFAEVFHQLLQIKTTDRYFSSGRRTDIYKKEFEENIPYLVDVETCKPFPNDEDFMDGIEGDYSTPDMNITHNRTKTFDFMTKEQRMLIHNYRMQMEKLGNLKRPTDIIIFTDSFSYSATSIFIKGFQNTGGAILVGFNGNPKLSKDLFDASQSPTNVVTYQSSQEYVNLSYLGFIVRGVSASESFNYDYNKTDAIPREYQFDPVDERVDIYESYTDEKYQLFINKAKQIFEDYNKNNKCNKNNKKLLYDPNDGKTCYTFDDDSHAHGGYECGDDGIWNTTECKKYYCDMGYYFDPNDGKCKADLCVNDPNEKYISLTKEYSDTIVINEKNNIEYVFQINNKDYLYIFQVEGEKGYIHYDNNYPCPNLCIVHYPNQLNQQSVHINYYRNATNKDVIIKISSIKYDYKNLKVISVNFLKEHQDNIIPLGFPKLFYVFEGFVDFVSYFQTSAENIQIKYAEYNTNMTGEDIINMNEKYFQDCNGVIKELEASKIYILGISSLSSELNNPLKMLLQPKIFEDTISIMQNKKSLIYFSPDKEYTLDFSSNSIERLIQLSHSSLDSVVNITYEEGNYLLNSSNLYFKIGFNYRGSLKIKSNNKGALIEFLTLFGNNVHFLTDKEFENYKPAAPMMISFQNNGDNKDVFISVFSKSKKPFKFGLITGYTTGKYYHNYDSYSFNNIPQTVYQTIKLRVNKKDLVEGEYFYMLLLFENTIYDDLYQIHVTKIENIKIENFNVDMEESKCKLTIDSMVKLIEEGYAYNDIIKNPPNKEYFGQYDLIGELKKVETSNRKYFDFYRDIRRITAHMKDGHFNILPKISPNNYNLENIQLCLPFSFYIKGNNPETAELYIEKYENCFNYYTQEEQAFIENNLDKPLLSINETDPFEFIQNLQSEFYSAHNEHALFSKNLENAHKLKLTYSPYTQEQISNIEFSFKNGDNITLDYYIVYTGLPNEKEKNEKNWKFSMQMQNGVKCLVDDEKHVNVLEQGTFMFFEDDIYKDAIDTIDKCINEFYSNDYPIVVIENNNGGGQIKVGLYLAQLLQVKVSQRTYFAVKKSDLIKNEFEKDLSDKVNVETCSKYDNFDELGEVIDEYGSEASLKRTKVFQKFDKETILKVFNKRKELHKGHIKRPTDIIIFTDSFSFSTTSFMIKGLQEKGGAIVVGYKGNPKSDEIFDASQSPSSITWFYDSDIYNNLENCGFNIVEITYYQSFNHSYQAKNPTPREFTIFPVDERVNIYHKYNDTYYDEFIDKALEIFDKYNKDNKCNKDNKLLTLDPNDGKNCYVFDNDEHAHGGYICGDNGAWTQECVPYYCDLGYIFDTYQKKCVEDVCTKEDQDTTDGKNTDTTDGGYTDLTDKGNTDGKEDGTNEFPVYAIVLISVGGVAFIILLIVVIFKCCLKKDQINSESIGPLEQGNKDANVELAEREV